MNLTSQLKAKRNAVIHEEACELYVKGFRMEIIEKMLGEKYWLDSKTIARIITKQGKIKK